MDKQQDVDAASSFFRCDDEEDLSDIEHDLHPDDGLDEEVHAEATRPHPSSCNAPALRAAAPADETSLRSPGGDDDGDDDDGDDEGSAAYGSVEDATSEWTCRFCTLTSESTNALLCSICGTKRVERTERTDPPMRGILDEADSIEIRPIRHENYENDEEWVLFDENRHLCYGWDIGTPRGNLCYVRYVGRENEKSSSEMEWRQAHRRGRSRIAAEGGGDGPQKKTVAQLQAEEHLKKKRRRSSTSTKVSRPKPPMKKRGSKGSHYLEDRLGKSKREILGLMPRAIADQIHNCVWVPWKGVHHPGLILGPFDISGETAANEEVGKMIETAIQMNRADLWNRHLVFWYSAGFSLATGGAQKTYKAFTLENPDELVPYWEGVELGHHRPENLVSKINSPSSLLTYKEDVLWNGIKQLQKDAMVEKQERGGPFFFEHQMNLLREAATRSNKERAEKMKQKQIENTRKREERREKEAGDDTKFLSRFVAAELCSLEICSGEGRMTEGLRKAGVDHRNTLDFDPKKASDSNLSLEQLHDMMQDGDHRCRHHLTQKCWNILFAAPDCSTYSMAQSTKIYRTESEIYILGFVYMYMYNRRLFGTSHSFLCLLYVIHYP